MKYNRRKSRKTKKYIDISNRSFYNESYKNNEKLLNYLKKLNQVFN